MPIDGFIGGVGSKCFLLLKLHGPLITASDNKRAERAAARATVSLGCCLSEEPVAWNAIHIGVP